MYILWNLNIIYCTVIFALLYWLLYNLLTKYFNYWNVRNVPHKKPVLFFGTDKDFLLGKLNLGAMASKHYKAWPNEKLFGCFQSRWPEIIIRDPDLIRDVLVKDFHYFSFREKPFNYELEPLLKNLFHLNDERWNVLRKKLTPLFSSAKLKDMFYTMTEQCNEFISLLDVVLRNSDVVDIREISAKYTTDVIGSCAFGIKMNSMIDDKAPFRQMGRAIFDTGIYRTIRMILRIIFPGLANFLKVRMFKVELQDFMTKMILKILDQRKNEVSTKRNFIDLLIELRKSGHITGSQIRTRKDTEDNAVEMEITDDILIAQAFAFFAGGFETSSTAMSFALYEMALNPKIQERAYNEIRIVLQNHSGNITYEGIQEMKYLEMVISETLRKYPPLPVLTRECTSQYMFSETNVEIDTNCTVIIPVIALQRDPKYYPNPDKFDPGRFSPQEVHSRHPYVYLPFGEGPRGCIGVRFGKVQSMVGLATLLRNFRVLPCQRTPLEIIQEPSSYVTVHKDKLWLKLIKR